jgi:hypothetical protein
MIEDMKIAFFIDDAQSKIDSSDFAYRHLRRKDEKEKEISIGTWCFMFFLLGMLFSLTIPYSIADIVMFFTAG